MTVLCGGGASQAKPASFPVSFFSGQGLQAILIDVFGVSEAWAALLAMAAITTIEVTSSSFCTTDPPTLTWPSAADILFIASNPVDMNQPAYQHLNSVVQNALWYTLCECASTTTPAPPTPPAYPTGAPVLNPRGFGTSSTPPCYDTYTPDIVYPSGIGGVVSLWPNFHATGFYALDAQQHTVVITRYLLPISGASTAPAPIRLQWHDSSNVLQQQSVGILASPPYAQGVVAQASSTVLLPAGTKDIEVDVDTSNDTVSVDHWARVQIYCGTDTPTSPLAPCCPPDPTLEAYLRQIMQMLQTLMGSPLYAHSYSTGTVHAGLTGNGSVTLAGPAMAVKVSITSDTTGGTVISGDPSYLWSRGFIVPIAAGNPMHGMVRLVYNPQLFVLPPLTDQVGYTLPPGVTASITEMLRGS